MSNPIIKISVQPHEYDALRTLGTGVVVKMTSNPSFPTPTPSLATIQTATDNLHAAIIAWGTPGHRGSHSDLVRLRGAAINLRNLLKLEASYVMNLIDPNANELDQKAFLLSSGFGVKKDKAPQGVLQAPVNLHQVISPRFSLFTPKLKWSKPQGLNNRLNVKSYVIFRSLINDFSTAEKAGMTTTTSFIDVTAPLGTTCYYFVVGMNTAGLGVECDGVKVAIPA